ncbi:MAG: thiamine-phosphate kinase [Steroidobacteraceae bacterium]
MGEFDLIRRYFISDHYSADVLLGVGDDAAVMDVPPGYKLVAAVDTIVSGVHFPENSSAADIAYRALAVNLSDMAAMGAQPRWFTLSLCIPEAQEAWLAEFALSLKQLAGRYDVQLVGGDTVKGPLNISVQILGVVESDRWLTRASANPGDVVFVSGVPGEAAGGLQLLLQPPITMPTPHHDYLVQRFARPTPRVELGRCLRQLASAAMDVSDGLLTDLSKLCAASGCGAHLDLEALPQSSSLLALFDKQAAERFALSGGDDYELVFTVPGNNLLQLEAALAKIAVPCTPIGRMVAGNAVQCYRDGVAMEVQNVGFDHFAKPSDSEFKKL